MLYMYVCVILGYARNLSPSQVRTYTRAHTHNPPPLRASPQKINRIEPFLQIQIAGRVGRGKNAPARDPLSRSSLFDFGKTFRRALQNTTRHGSAIRCQNKKFDSCDRERERVSPSLAHDRSSFNDFSGARREEGGGGVTMRK